MTLPLGTALSMVSALLENASVTTPASASETHGIFNSLGMRSA